MRPASRSGGFLQTCAVMMFCKCEEFRAWRTSRKASQIVLTLEVLIPGLDINALSRMVFSVELPPRVSLYMVFETSSSLGLSAKEGLSANELPELGKKQVNMFHPRQLVYK